MNIKRKNKIRVRLNINCFGMIIVLIFLFSGITKAQNYFIKYLTTKDGLTNGCIHDIVQDKKGFMWFATEAGLNRYDGYEIKTYSFGQNQIRSIYEDSTSDSKYLWIGTGSGGLIKFNEENEKYTQYRHIKDDQSSISDNQVNSICKDKDGFIWVGTNNGGLNKFDPHTGKFTSYLNNPNYPYSIKSNSVMTVLEDYLGYIWVGTYYGGLDRFDPKTNKFYHY